MVVMTRALPNLQQIKISYLHPKPEPEWGRRHKSSEGGDPDEEEAAETANYTTHDIEIISRFSKLRSLEIDTAGLNGRYPFLFNGFPLLEKLSINYCHYLKWDLEMIAGLPLLKELECGINECLTGSLKSLRVLKDTLEKVKITNCARVEGNFMDLADFPHLKELDLFDTAVTGDIRVRDIGDNNFSALERLRLPKGVYGGRGYELQRISDAPDLVRAVYLLNKQCPAQSMLEYWYAVLSEDSPDWYESFRRYPPPFQIKFVEAGDYRIGYQWDAYPHHGVACEVNWLDPEPNRESSDYDEYIEDLLKVSSQVYFYIGSYQPPTEEEYHRLVEEDKQRIRTERSERLTVG